MERIDLTDTERELLQKLPGPPVTAAAQVNNIWIVEWLQAGDQLTGLSLHKWMEGIRPGWSAYFQCKTKQEVLSAIEHATTYVKHSGRIPVLHLEAHGDETGLTDGSKDSDLLRWAELTEPLQRLNLMTRCNLILFVAACTGIAATQVFTGGPRAPAAALVGPDTKLPSNILRIGAMEFYRRLMRDKGPFLGEMADSASQQAGTNVTFEREAFVIFAYEAMVERLIVSVRQNKQRIREDSQIQRLMVSVFQKAWEEMFMIDLYPENRGRFGVDLAAIVELVVRTNP